jgi:hypothetical protein
VLVAAAANFAWQLGSSSYYVDEVLSVQASSPSLGGLFHAVRTTEITPPAYFLFLHEWLRRSGAGSEWAIRLPSALAAVVLVGAIWWLASLFGLRWGALAATVIAACSPFVLEYAQRAQTYVFVMLAVTVAVASAIQANRSPRRGAWLALSLLAAISALWLHYTAGLVIAPLCAWIALRARIAPRVRAAYVSVCVLAQLLVVPLFIDQNDSTPLRGVVGLAGLSWSNVVRIVGTPFDGRPGGGVGALRIIGALIALAAVAAVAARGRAVRDRRLLLALALLPPVALLALTAAGENLALSRYDAIAAPFVITALGALTTLRASLAAPLLVGALVVSVTGLIDSHRRSGFYLDARGVTEYIQRHQQAGDLVVTPGQPGADVPLAYYAGRYLRPVLAYSTPTGAGTFQAVEARQRLWVISELSTSHVSSAQLLAFARGVYAGYGYRPTSVRIFPASVPLAVLLLAPQPVRSRQRAG